MADVTFYHNPQSRGRIVRWMLEEIGQPYELVSIDLQAGDQKKPEYLKINPKGRVPRWSTTATSTEWPASRNGSNRAS